MTRSERLRAAYLIFLKDMFRRAREKVESETEAWWSGLMTLSSPEDRPTNGNTSIAVISVTSRTVYAL